MDQLGTWRRLKLGPHRVDVSYGSLGGARAIEHLRAICSELQIAHVRQQLSFSLFTDFVNFSLFNPAALHDDAAGILFEQLETWASAMKFIAPRLTERRVSEGMFAPHTSRVLLVLGA